MGLILPLEPKVLAVAVGMQKAPSAVRHGFVVRADQLAAVGADRRFAVDRHYGFALFGIALKKRIIAAPPGLNGYTVTSRSIPGVWRFSIGYIFIHVTVWILPESRSIPAL